MSCRDICLKKFIIRHRHLPKKNTGWFWTPGLLMLERGNPGRRRGLYPPGGIQTHALGQCSIPNVSDQKDLRTPPCRGDNLVPPRGDRPDWVRFLSCRATGFPKLILAHPCMGGGPRPPPRRGGQHFRLAGEGLVYARPCMGGGPRPSPAGKGSTDDSLQRLILAHPYMGGGPHPSPAGRGSTYRRLQKH